MAYRSKNPTRPRKSAAEKAAEAQALSDRYTAFRESLSPAEVASYHARFDHYSERNALLVVMQDPYATVVQGYQDWKKHGRRVFTDGRAKGKGIHIVTFTGYDDNRSADTTGTAPSPSRTRGHFGKACVFDIRYTEPIPPVES